MGPEKNFYKVLQVPENATESQIKSAYSEELAFSSFCH